MKTTDGANETERLLEAIKKLAKELYERGDLEQAGGHTRSSIAYRHAADLVENLPHAADLDLLT